MGNWKIGDTCVIVLPAYEHLYKSTVARLHKFKTHIVPVTLTKEMAECIVRGYPMSSHDIRVPERVCKERDARDHRANVRHLVGATVQVIVCEDTRKLEWQNSVGHVIYHSSYRDPYEYATRNTAFFMPSSAHDDDMRALLGEPDN